MATENLYTGDGSTVLFNITFEYLDESDIKMEVKDTTSDALPDKTKVQGTHWELANPTTIRCIGGFVPSSTQRIRLFRQTDISNKAVTYASGSAIRAQDLNKANDQVIFSVEEWRDQRVPLHGAVMPDDLSMGNNQITNLGDANSDDDAANRKQLGNIIKDDISGVSAQGVILTKTEAGSNSGDQLEISMENATAAQKGVAKFTEAHAIGIAFNSGEVTISADKSTASQQGVVKISEQNNGANGNPVDVNYTADGEVEIGIADNTIDLAKLKNVDVVVESEQDTKAGADTALTDNELLTGLATSKRHDIIMTSDASTPAAPSPGGWTKGKLHYDSTTGSEVLKIWTGTQWVNVSAGVPYTPPTTDVVRYVDATNGNDNNTGILPQSPLKTIKKAVDLVNAETGTGGHGTLIKVAAGVYQETLPISIQKNNVSIVGEALRSVFVQPTAATETETMFLCDSGTLLANMTFVGLKAKGNTNNTVTRDANGRITTVADRSTTENNVPALDPGDSNGAFGLPRHQGWVAAFRQDAFIKKSPYIQNCSNFADSGFDNSSPINQSNLPTHALGGDKTSACSGGGILCDGNVPAVAGRNGQVASSPLRSFVVDSFTQVTFDGPGILCTNNGYAQLVSFFGTFCHYHAKSRNGGQLNLSNCTTDFGRFGLIAEGRSNTAIATATVDGDKADGETVVRISETAAASGWHGDSTNPRPLDNMLIEIDGIFYPILSCTPVGGTVTNTNHWDVTVSRPDQNDFTNNLGINGAISNGDAVNLFLRSLISTGGHTFEYVGSGCDYNAHPDNGGVAVEANQVQELKTNNSDEVGGKVWQSSTDHNGKFKVGSTFTVNQQTGQIDIPDAASTAVQKTGTTGSAKIPKGTTGQRDSDGGTPANLTGFFRFNTTDGAFEGHDGTAWGSIGGGASAGGAIYENVNTISADYTITTNSNGMTAGPITINSGVTVTVPSGSTWTIV